MLKLETQAELEGLYAGQIKESLSLEYKASAAVDGSDKQKLEMARDVSAFANADGGQIIYGMTEKDHLPAGLDTGVDQKKFPAIWFEQVLQQNISPHVHGLRVREVPLATGNVAVVIEIPAATGDPHQAADHKYYRRHNFNRLPMDHYEVKALFNRATKPEPFLEFTFPEGKKNSNVIQQPNDDVLRFDLQVHLGNRAAQPAFYAVIHLFIHIGLFIGSRSSQYKYSTIRDAEGFDYNVIGIEFGIPRNFPIFKEAKSPIFDGPLGLTFDGRTTRSGTKFPIGYEILTPGYEGQEFGNIMYHAGRLTITFPGPLG